jgi:hypothetical protein
MGWTVASACAKGRQQPNHLEGCGSPAWPHYSHCVYGIPENGRGTECLSSSAECGRRDIRYSTLDITARPWLRDLGSVEYAPFIMAMDSPEFSWGNTLGSRVLQKKYYCAATVCCLCVPSLSMPNSITSPTLRKVGGVMPIPTPGGVPVLMRSPGSSTMN